ncbi:hypothetical protein BT67DRAFT_434761 [Trichocladium antarcticum]|uniref:Uncharacterized protein n=1 Tax=Trichocladium antarcticum TaxID=1450529 RepID=A0AAN6ZCK1_9PEZI|nr:hypothetical protein BT67DRAFT_434761 [Trichocladium antarcticum]
MAPPWQDLELSWADVRVDTSLRPLLLQITSQPFLVAQLLQISRALFKRRGFFGRLRPIFVEWYNGLYLRRWLYDFCSRPNRREGFFVQFFGYNCVSVPKVLNGKYGNCL